MQDRMVNPLVTGCCGDDSGYIRDEGVRRRVQLYPAGRDDEHRGACAVALARAGPTRSIRMSVARLLDTVIISSSRSRTDAFWPTRRYSELSESSPLSSW